MPDIPYMVKTGELRAEPPFCDIFRVNRDMVDCVATSMSKCGYDVAFPIVVWHGVVIDGHTRLSAARKANIREVPCIYREFADEAAAIEYAIRCQRNRRNLTDAELLRCIQEVDRRMDKRDTLKRGNEMPDPQHCGTGESAAATASVVGVSQRKVEQARTVIDHAPPEVKAKLDTGELTINAAELFVVGHVTPTDPHPHDDPATDAKHVTSRR